MMGRRDGDVADAVYTGAMYRETTPIRLATTAVLTGSQPILSGKDLAERGLLPFPSWLDVSLQVPRSQSCCSHTMVGAGPISVVEAAQRLSRW
jgi:hypothetical protein